MDGISPPRAVSAVRAQVEPTPAERTAAEPTSAEPLARERPGAELLVAAGIEKRWRTWKQPILRGADLAVGRGESVWIQGRNGTGKTSLLRIVCGMIAPDAGTVTLDGLTPADGRRYRAQVGIVTAGNAGLFARLSVERHLDYWARLAFVPRKRRAEAVERTLDAFSLREIAKRRVDRLSMGQRQRVRISMAFLHEPKLVLLDEPHTSLDDEGVAMLREAVGDVLARGDGCVWCSPAGEHPVLGYSRRLEMRDGRLERL